nr:hypothetical protein Iba_chr10bCG10250 [Ipomoea batatas]
MEANIAEKGWGRREYERERTRVEIWGKREKEIVSWVLNPHRNHGPGRVPEPLFALCVLETPGSHTAKAPRLLLCLHFVRRGTSARLRRHGLTEGNPPLSSPATLHCRKEREGHVADEPPAACRASTPATATNHRCFLPSLSPAAQPLERGTPSGKENESRRSVAPVSHLAAIVACCFNEEGSPLMVDWRRSAINEKKRKESPFAALVAVTAWKLHRRSRERRLPSARRNPSLAGDERESNAGGQAAGHVSVEGAMSKKERGRDGSLRLM